MKNYSILWVLGLCLLPSHPIAAMRRGPSLLHHTLRMHQYFLVRQLQQQKQKRALCAVASYNWSKSDCYKKLKEDPNNPNNYRNIDQQLQITKQALLETALQDPEAHPKMLVKLLAAGADLNKPDLNGQTPLHKLAQSTQTDKSEMRAQILLAYLAHHNPNFNAQDAQGNRPCDLAHEDVKEWFQEHDPICWSKLKEMYRHL